MGLVKYFAIILILISSGCTIIYREYSPVIIAYEGSTVYFPVEILAEVEKDSEVSSQIETDANVRGSFVPGAFGM